MSLESKPEGRPLILGSSGQLGRALASRCGGQAHLVSRDQLDLASTESLGPLLRRLRPTAVINAAAYTQVDLAESQQELAYAVNGRAPAELARWCAEHAIPLVHFSTDYVYPGHGDSPQTEETPTGPLGTYGASKLAGDQAVLVSGAPHLIFRTSWMYGGEGKNFLRSMLALGAERETLRVVSDQIGAPTYAGDLAELSLRALDSARAMPVFPSGVYHLCNLGETSWHGFAQAIFERARKLQWPIKVKEVTPIRSSEWPAAAARPLNSRLSTHKFARTFQLKPAAWEDALGRCLEEMP